MTPRTGLIALLMATALSLLTACQGDDAGTRPAAYRQLDIPMREHGYSSLTSRLINSQSELDALLAESRASDVWNEQQAVEDALRTAAIDFQREALVLLCHQEGSGSIQLTPGEPVLRDGKLALPVTRQAPEVGTADMAYYCFAIAVTRDHVSSVELRVSDRVTATVAVTAP